MNTISNTKIKPISIWKSFLFFIFPIIGIYLSINKGIPFFMSLGIPRNVSYMISMTCTLLPVLIIALCAYKAEGNKFNVKDLFKRFRIKKLNKSDWLWILIGFIVILIFSGIFQALIVNICKAVNMKYDTMPPEFGFRIIKQNEWWIFLVHLFYFLCNILGEEFLYRGYLLPRQILNSGKYAWIINGSFWFVAHLGVGLSVITMIPLLFTVPFIVQRRENSLIGIIIHGVIAGMGFYLAAFGLVK